MPSSSREYTYPSVKTLLAQDIVELMGPAQANASGGGGGAAGDPMNSVSGGGGGGGGSSFGRG